jgi:hypothetical protein
MAFPYDLDSVAAWTATDLATFPSAEDEWHEYKSGRISAADLRKQIAIAASGFWNTGGGIIAAGVDASGRPDVGVPSSIGRTPIRDWVDGCLREVAPRGEYRIVVLTDEIGSLAPGQCILVVAFGESHIAPHMAPDGRYYIRAGALTVPAPHFVVEALMARRGLTQPVLRPIVRHKPGVGLVVQLGLVAASPAPALDVQLTIPEPPEYLRSLEGAVSVSTGVISPETPLFLDLHVRSFGDKDLEPIPIQVRYRDLAGRPYEDNFVVDIERQLGITLMGEAGYRGLEDRLRDIDSAVRALGGNIKSNEQHLRTIANKLK